MWSLHGEEQKGGEKIKRKEEKGGEKRKKRSPLGRRERKRENGKQLERKEKMPVTRMRRYN